MKFMCFIKVEFSRSASLGRDFGSQTNMKLASEHTTLNPAKLFRINEKKFAGPKLAQIYVAEHFMDGD